MHEHFLLPLFVVDFIIPSILWFCLNISHIVGVFLRLCHLLRIKLVLSIIERFLIPAILVRLQIRSGSHPDASHLRLLTLELRLVCFFSSD